MATRHALTPADLGPRSTLLVDKHAEYIATFSNIWEVRCKLWYHNWQLQQQPAQGVIITHLAWLWLRKCVCPGVPCTKPYQAMHGIHDISNNEQAGAALCDAAGR